MLLIKYLLTILYILSGLITVFGQNLILNPSLEEHTSCSDDSMRLAIANYWYSPASPSGQPLVSPPPTISTTDYYSNCFTAPAYTPPHCNSGYQIPKDGVAYAGAFFFILGGNNYREYATATIIDPLMPGITYCLSFYISSVDNAKYGVDKVGAYFSADSMVMTTPYLSVTPQIETPPGTYFADTSEWMLVSGEYTAVGGEKFITIGNFHADWQTGTTVANADGNDGAYYYIDYFSLIKCGVGVEEFIPNKFDLYPNPTTGMVSFNYNLTNDQQGVFEMYSITGQLVYSQKLVNQTQQINIALPLIENGIYFAHFTVDNKPVFNERVVVIK